MTYCFKKSIQVLFALSVIIGIGACGQAKPPATTQGHGNAETLIDTYWELTALNGSTVTEDVMATKNAHIIFNEQEKRVTGSGGCNRFFGSYEHTEDGSLNIGEIGATKMMCPPGTVDEQAYFSVLSKVNRYTIQGNMLQLAGDDAQIIASFEAIKSAPND
ncbi:META domain-containing protein [Glaciecola siphonariae]|uniref:META domain-containing protein n=1 Tax=Glaciecola siphonariae TaxID=521012 RepID=A0ABV9LXE6_9ALTE